ncbi:MAG: hypothetical protein MK098_03235 [Marinovum sp.]|nr:hypothetical protein [Marinovum sp.]
MIQRTARSRILRFGKDRIPYGPKGKAIDLTTMTSKSSIKLACRVLTGVRALTL